MCNAYTELNDPVIQRERFADQVKVSFNPNILTCINLDIQFHILVECRAQELIKIVVYFVNLILENGNQTDLCL